MTARMFDTPHGLTAGDVIIQPAGNIIAPGTLKVTSIMFDDNTTVSTASGLIGGEYTLPVASSLILGGVKVDGSSVTIANGVISATMPLPIAGATTLGGVKIGAGLSVAGDGTISSSATDYTLPIATSSLLGGVKVDGSTITIANGVISSAASLGYTAEDASKKGAANGFCPLDGTSKVPASFLPSYVDDVVEYADFASLPVVGETGKIYVALDDNSIYRWSGTQYISIGAGSGSIAGSSSNSITAQFQGTVQPITGTQRHYPRGPVTIVSMFAWVSTVAGIDIVASILKNGVAVQSITIPSGSSTAMTVANISLIATDYLTVDIISGTGLNLTIRLDY